MKLADLHTPLPGEVRHTYDEIVKGTGVEPDIERRDNGRRYRLAVNSDRVRMQIDYKLTGRRWVWAASQLYVDGVQRPIMKTPQHFYRLWHDPDSDGYPRADPADEPPIEPYPLEDAPEDLRVFVERLRTRFEGREGKVLTFGRHPDGTPVVHVDNRETGGTLLLRLERVGPTWFPSHLRLTRGGYDRTSEAGGSFEEALRLLLGDWRGPAVMPSGGPKVRGASDAQRNTSVDVRKQTVIRV